MISALIAIDKVLQAERYISQLQIAAASQFHVRRYILRPFLGGIECNNPDWIAVLAFEQIEDDGFEIGGLDIRLPINSAIPPEIVNYEVRSTASSQT